MGRLSLVLILLAASPMARAMEALTFDEIAELLRAELPERVVLSIVSELDPPDLTADQWLRLRGLGATDEILLALLPPDARLERIPSSTVAAPEPPPRPEPAAATPARPADAPDAAAGAKSFRAYYDEDPEVGKVFVLTNLDADGEPLAGGPEPPARRNVVTGWSAEEARIEAEKRRAAEERALAVQMAAAEPATPVSPPPAPAASLYPGGFAGTTAFIPTGRGHGFFFRYPRGHLYPPGSYTHFKLYHSRIGRGLAHYQLPAGQIFYTPPFRAAASHHR